MNRGEMCFIGKLSIDSFYVMIVNEIVKVKVAHVLQIFYSMRDFEIIMIIVAAIKGLVKCVVSYAVKCTSIYPAAVITMDNLSHQPEVRLHFFSSTPKLFHKVKIKNICCIKADAVYIKFRNPETDHITNVILNIRIALI